jgi:ATP-dependent Zn protease
MRNNGGNNKAFDFGKTRAKLQKGKTTTFKNVAGVDEEKEELEELIDFLKDPKKIYESWSKNSYRCVINWASWNWENIIG